MTSARFADCKKQKHNGSNGRLGLVCYSVCFQVQFSLQQVSDIKWGILTCGKEREWWLQKPHECIWKNTVAPHSRTNKEKIIESNSQHMQVTTGECLNEYTGLYIVCILRISHSYSFSEFQTRWMASQPTKTAPPTLKLFRLVIM